MANIPFSPSSSSSSSSQRPKWVLNPTPISVAPPRSPVHPSVQPSIERFIKEFEENKRNEASRKRKDDSSSDGQSERRPDCLPIDWEIKEYTRKGGKMAGSKYKYYVEPGTKQVFRSLLEVRRYIGLGDTPKRTKTANKMNGGTETEQGEVAVNGNEEEEVEAQKEEK